jgi:ribosomal protein L11
MSRSVTFGLVAVAGLAWFAPADLWATEYFMIITQTKGDVDDSGALVWRPGPPFDSSLDMQGMKPTREVVKEVRQRMDASGDYVHVEILSDTKPIEWKGGPPPASLLLQDARLRNGYDPKQQPTPAQLQDTTDKILKEQQERSRVLNESLTLEARKRQLDEAKARLDQARAALLGSLSAVQAAEKELDALKQQGGAENGPYTAVRKGYEDVMGGRKTFATYAEAAAWADGGTVTDRNGKVVTSPPAADPATQQAMRDAEAELQKLRAANHDGFNTYLAAKQDYQKALDAYEKENGQYKKSVDELKKQTYNPPK